ncbi:MAG TPA: DNA methyltransferase, partial [Candidatus Saccharimonadales bacterium]|nr:DNA methyltransferase [Candidatus Saccharimonadales bacterium]
MPLSWNEIRHNAIQFANEWKGATSERAEKQTFWNEFFQVFGVKRRVVASFEEPVKKISGDYGYIDLFWPGVVLVEHKSFGANLGKAESQAFEYVRHLAHEKRIDEIPRYIIVSDFARIALHDLDPEEQRDLPLLDQRRGATYEFPLADFHRNVHHFAFIPGYKQHIFQEQDPVNIEAVKIMGALHDALEYGGYSGHDLERFLVRVLFCLFAEDTGIFERESFHLFIENRTAPDGSDLGQGLARLFEILNTPPAKRQTHLDETLASFPFVNGVLFSEHLGFADFNRDMRNALLACTRKDWSRISPAIFGSLFQSIMEDKKRRQIGAHYTSERDILKVIRSLFLDELRAEFETRKADRSTNRRARLEEFHDKLCNLRFFDPACGCGNFLVIGYRDLRELELETLKEIFGRQTELTLDDITKLSQVDVDQFYGIEIEEWPARIAEVALWLMDHQMNLKVSEAFGQLYQRLPLKKSPTIVCSNALRLDWKTILPPSKCSYVLGNPPFVGSKFQTAEQRADMDGISGEAENSGLLDYVTGWYFKAAQYIQGTAIVAGFVSTNSISQGEQVGVLWNYLFQHWRLKILFAHRTFSWMSEARGKAHVHVVIIGFAAFDKANKRIYDCEGEKTTVTAARNISPYLVEGSDLVIISRSTPLCEVPPMSIGNKPIDDGNYLFTPGEKSAFLREEPAAREFFRRWIGSEEFINGIERWCLWLGDCPPEKLRRMPRALERVEKVRKFRLASKSAPTRKIADTPTRFHVENMPGKNYLVVPKVSSERRRFIPIGFVRPSVISSDLLQIVPGATHFHFGILSSGMHMAWVRQVCGRLESRYRYSNRLVYNNFPWPNPTVAQRERIVEKCRGVLAARATHLPPRGTAALADLYDPLTMPPEVLRAHAGLDRAVDKCYRSEPFHSDRERVEFLFSLYEKLTAPLLPATPSPRHPRSK